MSTLASKARSAVLWNAGFKLFRDGLQFASMLILTRLLPKEYYGHFAFVGSVVGFISMFSLNSFISHLVQVKDDKDAHFQDHFTAGAVLNLAMFLITNVVAICLRWHPKFAIVSPFLHVMSLTFLLEWPCNLRIKMIERDLDWRKLRSLHALGLIGSTALGITMACAGMKTYALLVPQFVINLPFIFDLFIGHKWRPTWEFDWAKYRDSFQFGLTRIGSGLVLKGRELIEAGIIASMLNWDDLGVFSRATALAALLCLNIASQFLYALYPVLTRLSHEDGKAALAGSLVMQTIAWITIPLATSFALLAGSFIPLIYGNQWNEVIRLIPFTMTLGVLFAMCHATYMLLLARPNQARLCLRADIFILLGTTLGLCFALPHGVNHYISGLILCHFCVLLMVGRWLRKEGSVALRTVLPPLGSALIAATASGLILHFAGGDFSASAQRPIAIAVAWGIGFCVLYTLVLRLAFRRHVERLMPYLPLQSSLRQLLFMPRPETKVA